jgi:hypothetical protein
VWPIVLWLAIGSIPASFATHWVLDNYLSQSTHYKAVLTMVLGFMLTITGLSIVFRNQIEKFFNKLRKDELPDMMLVKSNKYAVVNIDINDNEASDAFLYSKHSSKARQVDISACYDLYSVLKTVQDALDNDSIF